MIAGQVGIAGSSIIGNNVMVGGQAGISGHLTIGNNVQIGGGSGVIKNIPDNTHNHVGNCQPNMYQNVNSMAIVYLSIIYIIFSFFFVLSFIKDVNLHPFHIIKNY